MANWIAPAYTNSRIKKAGKNIRNKNPTTEDLRVLENHRRAHARILNTHQARLRGIVPDQNPVVAQRLKRRPTIIDKLIREPNMQLSTMQDIAGCRVILKDIQALDLYREALFDTRVRHVHINKGKDHYNYIKYPKQSGYRGVHEVFKTRTGRRDSKPWDNLLVEIQLRTKAQHAWATAVETIDLLNGERAKFGESDEKLARFFALASEIIARAHEDKYSCLPDVSHRNLVDEFNRLDQVLNIVRRLNDAVRHNPEMQSKKTNILIFNFDDELGLEVKSYPDIQVALTEYERLENKFEEKADIVLVRAENVEDIKRSFQNYFSDAQDFVSLINEGINKLG